MGGISKTSNFFTDETKNMVLSCSRFETGSIIYYFWSFTMRSKSLSNFFLRPWCVSSPFYSKRGRYSVHLSDSSMGDVLKRSIFITEETKKVVLTSLPLGTASNIHYFWSFTMHSISSSNFFLRPLCTSTPFYSKGARYSVHLSDSSMGDNLNEANFFQMRPKFFWPVYA